MSRLGILVEPRPCQLTLRPATPSFAHHLRARWLRAVRAGAALRSVAEPVPWTPPAKHRDRNVARTGKHILLPGVLWPAFNVSRPSCSGQFTSSQFRRADRGRIFFMNFDRLVNSVERTSLTVALRFSAGGADLVAVLDAAGARFGYLLLYYVLR